MKQVYQADDGTQFDTQEEAVRYESVVGKKKAIVDWCENHYKNNRLTNKHANVIMTWESYRDEALSVV